MALDGSYEAKLLRLLVGYFHISVLQQIAVVRYGKGFHLLSPEEKNALEKEVVDAVIAVAHNASEETLSGTLKPPIVH